MYLQSSFVTIIQRDFIQFSFSDLSMYSNFFQKNVTLFGLFINIVFCDSGLMIDFIKSEQTIERSGLDLFRSIFY